VSKSNISPAGGNPGAVEHAHTAQERPSADDIARWLAVLHPADHAIEIRVPNARLPGATRPTNIVRRFAPGAFREAAQMAATFSGSAPAVYVVMNGIDPTLRRTGKLGGASAKDIPRRSRLLVDVDPNREGTCSATDDEKAAALRVGAEIRAELRARGWPEPLIGDSGNGDHSVYAIDLPNDDESTAIVNAALKALAARFDTEAVHVDTKVFDPPRLVKLYGTLAGKGENTAERPHRYARVVSAPATLEPVPLELLHALASEAPATAPAATLAGFDLAAEIERKQGQGTTDDTQADDGSEAAAETNGRAPSPEERAVKYLEKCEPAVSGQRGHDKAFRAACKVGPGFNLPEETAFRLLRDHYNERCQPEWSENELRHKVKEAYKVEKGRGWLLNAGRDGNARREGKPYPKVSANGNGEPRLDRDEDGDDGPEAVDRWPQIDPRAFCGLAGDIVGRVDAETEADPVAVLVQFLVAFGNLIGRTAHWVDGPNLHYLNLFACMVGATATGRKGTSWGLARWALADCDDVWSDGCIKTGLVSGEGLIYHVRDPVEKEGKLVDEGVTDKRLLVVETELSRTLKAMNRESNTLSDVIREAWDSGSLRTMAKHNATKATGAHISIVAHATQADVRQHLTRTDSANGFANRFLWVACRRSKLLPEGGDLSAIVLGDFPHLMRRAVALARETERMRREPDARPLWADVYADLTRPRPGLLGAICNRAEAQTMRLACLYALLDGSQTVGRRHVESAHALWRYCEDSARFIFGDQLGDPAADKLLAALRGATDGLTRKDISHGVFQRNLPGERLGALLSDLLTQGLIHKRADHATGGRPAERWYTGMGI
jgi:hypothetical protein